MQDRTEEQSGLPTEDRHRDVQSVPTVLTGMERDVRIPDPVSRGSVPTVLREDVLTVSRETETTETAAADSETETTGTAAADSETEITGTEIIETEIIGTAAAGSETGITAIVSRGTVTIETGTAETVSRETGITGTAAADSETERYRH